MRLSQQVKGWCENAKVIPVISIDNLDDAVPLVRALHSGGVNLVEITLRTPCALDAIQAIREEIPEIIVAAGTARTEKDIFAIKKSGAHFAISPGTTLSLLDAAFDAMIPIMPGVATASEVMEWNDYGLSVFKFFPAEHCGGVNALRAFFDPLSNVSFCPTGGISLANARSYLDLPNVLCVGGSWLAPKQAVQNKQWDVIEALVREAMEV